LICGIFYDNIFIRKWYHKGNYVNKRIVKEVIKEFQEWELPEVLTREIDIPSSSQKIILLP